MSEKQLKNRVAVVTGSARNIGRAIALALADEGASIVVNAVKSAAAAESVAAEIVERGGRAVVRLADVSDPAQADALVATAIDHFGGLDILVNNAAIRRETSFAELSYKEWRSVLTTILDGAFLATKAALPHLARSDAGAVINIGGMSAHTGALDRVHVMTAKAGLIGMTRGLANDLAPQGTTVNCVVPGLIATVRDAEASAGPHMAPSHKTLVGRRGTPEEVAQLVAYLAGPRARYLTGQTMHVNGGAFLP